MAHRTRVHYRACNLCEAVCGLAIEVGGREVTAIRGDEADPLSRGHVCPKALALADVWRDPDRLTRPSTRSRTTWRHTSYAVTSSASTRRMVVP